MNSDIVIQLISLLLVVAAGPIVVCDPFRLNKKLGEIK